MWFCRLQPELASLVSVDCRDQRVLAAEMTACLRPAFWCCHSVHRATACLGGQLSPGCPRGYSPRHHLCIYSADKGGHYAPAILDSPAGAGSDQLLSRRKIFKGAVGAAAVGAGADVLTGTASPASAAAQATTVEPGAVAPAVVVLTDAATIAVDASLGNDFRVTIAGSRTMGTPSNPVDGQKITFQVTQGTGGPFTITWGSGYEFSAGLPQPTLSTTAGRPTCSPSSTTRPRANGCSPRS